MAEPHFQPGDRVTIRHGRSHVWQVVRTVTAPQDREPAYALEDGMRRRNATESELLMAPAETPADRQAWWDRHQDSEWTPKETQP